MTTKFYFSEILRKFTAIFVLCPEFFEVGNGGSGQQKSYRRHQRAEQRFINPGRQHENNDQPISHERH